MNTKSKNPFTWIEIYVDDMSRAQKFYESVFDIQLTELPLPDGMDELQMMSFPWAENEKNITGALVKTDSLKPAMGGTIAYFTCEDCALEESRVEKAGGKLIQSKMSIGEYGFSSIAMDSEGNLIGLHSMK